jgi:putative membrane protein
MKTNGRGIFVFLTIVILPGCTGTPEQNDKKEQAQSVSSTPSANSPASKQVIDFLSFASEMRRMNITRGELAQQQSKNQALREYGSLLIEDQSKLNQEITALIRSKKIVLPEFIDLQYSEELATLRKKKGSEFDQAFISDMTHDHLEEVEAFREALTFNDQEVKTFALKYLPVIEKSLERLKDLSKEIK